MTNSIKHNIFYPHSPEVIWDYLTKTELIAQWLMKNDFQPIIGYDFQFHASPMPNIGFDGIVYCKVLEIVPRKKLTYSWKGGPGDGSITMDSIVMWTLVEKDNGTELFLEHSGFKVLENVTIYNLMDAGWLKNIKKIAELINVAKHG